MTTELKATAARLIGGIFKNNDGQFAQIICYTCEDKEFQTTIEARRKKNLPARAQNACAAVNVGAVGILVDSLTGAYAGTHTRYACGPNGLMATELYS
jgi:hypothetical protein